MVLRPLFPFQQGQYVQVFQLKPATSFLQLSDSRSVLCTVQLRTLCAARSLATLGLSTTAGPGPGELPSFWGSMVFRRAPIPRKGSGNQQKTMTSNQFSFGAKNSRCEFHSVWWYPCYTGKFACLVNPIGFDFAIRSGHLGKIHVIFTLQVFAF